MIRWSEEHEEELESLTKKQFFDSKIAKELSKKFQVRFTAMSIKRKRQRLNLFKKQNPFIDVTHFYIKLSAKKNGKGYNPAFMPLQTVEKYQIKNQDILILRKNNVVFISKMKEVERKNGQKNGFAFYVPYELVNSTKYNREIIEYLGKVNTKKYFTQTTNIKENKVDILGLLKDKINKKIQFTLNPLNKNTILINNGRASICNTIPRYLRVSKDLIQSLGLFQGEGSKYHFRRIAFVNSDSAIVNLFLNSFEKHFLISRKKWKCRLIYTNSKRDKELEKKLIKFWRNTINIPKENFVKSGFWKGLPKAKKGSVHVYLPSSNLREVWFSLLKFFHKLIKEDKKYAQWFLQGVLAADGCPITHKGYLQHAQIRIENKEEGELYAGALNILGIKAKLNIKNREIRISTQDNLLKVYTYDLFSLHKERQEKFLRSLLTRKRIKSKLKKIISKKINRRNRCGKNKKSFSCWLRSSENRRSRRDSLRTPI